MNSLLTLLVISTLIFPGGYAPNDDVTWETQVNGQWHKWGDQIPIDAPDGQFNLVIDSFQINGNQVKGVHLILYGPNGDQVAEAFYPNTAKNEWVNYKDEVRFKIHEVSGSGDEWGGEAHPETRVTVEKRKAPELSTSITTYTDRQTLHQNTSFLTTSPYWVKLRLTNPSSMALYNVTSNVTGLNPLSTSEGQISNGNVYTYVDKLLPGENKSFLIKAQTPSVKRNTTVKLTANITSEDFKGITYNSSPSTEITTHTDVLVKKEAGPDINRNTSEIDLYIGKPLYVTSTVVNNGDFDIYVDTNTSLPNATVSWTGVKVGPKNIKHLLYRPIIMKPGAYPLKGNLSVTYNDGSQVPIHTKTGTIKAHGPYLQINTTTNETKTTIKVTNTGDREAKLTKLAKNNTNNNLLNTSTKWVMVPPGNFFNKTVPATNNQFQATYIDVYGSTWKTKSGNSSPDLINHNFLNPGTVRPKEPGEVVTPGDYSPTPTPTPTQKNTDTNNNDNDGYNPGDVPPPAQKTTETPENNSSLPPTTPDQGINPLLLAGGGAVVLIVGAILVIRRRNRRRYAAQEISTQGENNSNDSPSEDNNHSEPITNNDEGDDDDDGDGEDEDEDDDSDTLKKLRELKQHKESSEPDSDFDSPIFNSEKVNKD